ncbi:thiamine diphosphokinase [Selenomonas sp. F0473]|uniref:thiamine diphosphokinase n=1 Tax=Selenomonas sp. F0473 TaxID=999423 RepID=UPI00029EAD7D|nr:thiamine diphosphokinase [Selenomonas sp. F0473]EKU70454.1 thiamine pyrophosphokinase [Selenomonas sp. F0473]
MHMLSLPGLCAALPCAATDALILVGGGRPPSPAWLTQLMSVAQGSRIAPPVWAIDRGVNLCRDASVPPSLLIGDGDSADHAAWSWAVERGTKARRYPREKDDTDTALALRIAAQLPVPPLVVLTAAFGGRLDHLFSTAAVCAYAPVPCVLADDRETLFYLHDGASLSIQCDNPPRAISLLPFTEECVGVSTEGLRWELSNAVITSSKSTTISNVFALENTSRRFSVSIERGRLGVYLCHKE